MHRLIGVTQIGKGLRREQLCHRLDFLKAQHIGRMFRQIAFDQRHTQPHRVDVPGGNRDHGAALNASRAKWHRLFR
jgi:hypothetical protein